MPTAGAENLQDLDLVPTGSTTEEEGTETRDEEEEKEPETITDDQFTNENLVVDNSIILPSGIIRLENKKRTKK